MPSTQKGLYYCFLHILLLVSYAVSSVRTRLLLPLGQEEADPGKKHEPEGSKVHADSHENFKNKTVQDRAFLKFRTQPLKMRRLESLRWEQNYNHHPLLHGIIHKSCNYKKICCTLPNGNTLRISQGKSYLRFSAERKGDQILS